MKYSLAFLLSMLPLLASGQTPSVPDSVVRHLISDLTDSWTVGIDSNSSAVDISVYNKYKSLFNPTATVDDDLAFEFVPGAGSGTYIARAVPKDFDVYAHDAALQVSKFRIDSLGPAVPVSGSDSLVYHITRTIYAEKPAKYVFQEPDTMAARILGLHPDIRYEKGGARAAADREQILQSLKSEMTKFPDALYKFTATTTLRIVIAAAVDAEEPVKIASIRVIANELRCISDLDNDGIGNAADISPSNYGEFTADGAPDADLDGADDWSDRCLLTYGSLQNSGCPEPYFHNNKQLEGALGLQSHTLRLLLPALNALGYRDASGADATDVLQSREGSINSPRSVRGIYAAGSYNYFFGKNARNIGVSIGFTYSRFTATYSLTDTMLYTYKASDGSDAYRRQIRISQLSEKMGLNAITVPILLDYRFKVPGTPNLIVNIKAGPSLTLISGTSDYDATIDVGGIYQIDSLTQRVTYNPYFDPGSTWNVYLTTEGINRQSSAPGAAAVFDQLNSSGNYDFASDKPYRSQQSVSRLTYALNVSLDGQYRRKLESPLAIRAGVHFIYAPSMGHKERYMPIERTLDDYNSVFNSNGKSTYFAYALNLGLVYSF